MLRKNAIAINNCYGTNGIIGVVLSLFTLHAAVSLIVDETSKALAKSHRLTGR